MKAWAKVLTILFILPIFSLGFFEYLQFSYVHMLRTNFLAEIEVSPKLSPQEKVEEQEFVRKMPVRAICRVHTPKHKALIESLGIVDFCGTINKFYLAQIVSTALILIALLHLAVTYFLSRRAARSRAALIRSFRLGWKSAVSFSLAILLGQTALAVYTLFYLTVALTDRYFPQLLLAIGFAGVWAFYQVTKLLLANIPIKSEEKAAEALTEVQAPELWWQVRSVAQKLGTAPPDNIIVGHSPAFYVTEFPVTHARGIATGRTLFLSAPLLQRMPLNEILAIIGHEMGHFKGEDTVLSRDLAPILLKSDRTMQTLRSAGHATVPAFFAMNVFSYFFEKVIHAFRRDREFEADSAGASVTSQEIAASALLRYSYQVEAHQRAVYQHLVNRADIEEARLKLLGELKQDADFWDKIGAKKIPHPFDSHPPMHARVEKLGFTIDSLRHHAIGDFGASAYEQLLGSEALANANLAQADILRVAQERLATQNAAPDNPENRAVLEKHFPTVEIKASLFNTRFEQSAIILFFIALPIGLIFAIQAMVGKAICLTITLLGMFYYRRHYLFERGNSLVLSACGIRIGSWNRELLFSEIKQIRITNQFGLLTLYFHLKQPAAPLASKPIFPWKRSCELIAVYNFEGKQRPLAEKIFRYFTRQIEG